MSRAAEDRETASVEQAEREPPAAGLYLVATPIGNLRDLTVRARDVLASVDLIACEDSRVSRKLLHAYGIETPTVSYHEHNAARQRPKLLEKLLQGAAIALISDAGTPLISDPGHKLVQAVIDAGLNVTALPGASAPLTALLLSGLPSDRFYFGGFLPTRRTGRQAALRALANVPATLLFFEGPSRLALSLADMAQILGDRPAAVCRELTKRFEEVRRDGLVALAQHYAAEGAPKGEIVIAVAPPEPGAAQVSDAALDDALRHALQKKDSLRDAVAAVSAETGAARKRVYSRALAMQRKRDGGTT